MRLQVCSPHVSADWFLSTCTKEDLFAMLIKNKVSNTLICVFVYLRVKVQNFKNPDLYKFKFINLQDANKTNNYMFKWLIVFR